MDFYCPICLSSFLEPNGTRETSPGPVAGGSQEIMGTGIRMDGSAGMKGGKSGGHAGPTRSNPVSATCATPCGHIFHAHCLNNWMVQAMGGPTCPTCRKIFTKAKVLSVYLNGSDSSHVVDTKADFNSLNNMHNTLIDGFNEMTTNYWELRGKHDVTQAQIMSLENELQGLRATLEARVNQTGIVASSSSTSGSQLFRTKKGRWSSRK